MQNILEDKKISKFCYSSEIQGNLLLFNSYNGKLISLKGIEKEQASSIIGGMADSDTNNFEIIIQKLTAYGFLVSKELDEELLERKKYFDKVYDSGLGLIIMPTEQCNFRCKYCYEKFEVAEMAQSTANNLILFLRRNIRKYTSLNIAWFGGEPLLAMKKVELISNAVIALCKDRKIVYDSSITTNGFLLSLDVFRKLQKLHITRYQITIDGIADIHDNMRVLCNGEGSFQRIIDNLMEIKENIRTPYVKFNIRVNVTQDSVDRIGEILLYMHEHFGDDRRFSFQFHAVGDWNNYNKKEQADEDIKMLNSTNLLYYKLVNSNIILNYEGYYHWLFDTMCYASKRNHFVVGADGKIYKCTVAFSHPQNQVGVLIDKGVIKWNEMLLARWISPRNIGEVTKCHNCFLCGSCHAKGCAFVGLVNEKNIGCGCEVDCIDYILQMLYLSRGKHNLVEEV